MAQVETIDPKTLPNGGFWKGFRGTTRGTEVILRHPRLLLYMLGALLINGVLIGLLVYWLWGQTDAINSWFGAHSQVKGGGFFFRSWVTFASWVHLLFVGLKWLVFVLIFFYVVPTLYTILLNLNPISALLASEMFKYVFVKEAGTKLPEAPFVKGLLRMILTELAKLIVMVLLMFIALLFNVIPVAGSVISVILMLVIGVQFSGWSYITPYYEALGYGYGKQRSAMRRQRSLVWGLGAVSAIPIFNFFALFIGPVAGALIAAELHKELGGAPAEKAG